MKLNWRQGILSIATMGMEWCWLYALLFLLNEKVTDGRLSIIGLWLLYPVAFIGNRLLRWWRWSKIYLYAINGLALLVGILLVVKIQLYSGVSLSDLAWLVALPRALAQILQAIGPELLIMFTGIILWGLGWRLSRLRVTFTTSVAEFQFGLAILLVVYVVTSLLGVQIANIMPLALLFFLLALVGMALAHSQDSVEWSMRSHRGLWIWLLLISIGLILALGLIIPSVVTADLMQLIVVPFKWMWSMIEKGVGFLLSLIPVPELTEEMLPSEPMTEMPPEEFAEAMRMPEWVMGAGRIGWNALVLGLILVALWQLSSQFFHWLRHRLMTTTGAEIEPLESAFRADLLSFLKGIVLALLRFRLLFWRRRKLKPLPSEITSVRQIYHQLLKWVGVGGWPRPVFQTPYEYLYTLEELLPMSKNALRFITERYVSARYGSSLPTEEELHQLRQSWHQVRRNRLKGLTGEHTRKKEITNG